MIKTPTYDEMLSIQVLPISVLVADDAAAIGEEDYFEHHGLGIGGCAGAVVAEAAVEAAQVEFVVEQVIQGVFEGAGVQLPFQVNGEKSRAGVDVFVAGHPVHPASYDG